jgi:hypothetical protein
MPDRPHKITFAEMRDMGGTRDRGASQVDRTNSQ